MSSILDPRGPLPPSVYWRRRILLLVVVLVVIGLIWWLISSLGGSSTPAANSPSLTPSVSVSTPPTVTSSPTVTTTASSPSASTTPSTTAAAPLCLPAQIKVSAHPLASAYPASGPVHIRFAVSTTSSTPCRRDVGQIANSVIITSGGQRIWSSDDCNPGGDHDVRTLSQGASYVETVTWNVTVSHPGCPSGALSAPTGTYSVVGHNLDVVSPPETFTLG